MIINRLAGAALMACTLLVFLNEAMATIIRHQNWFGVVLAVSSLSACAFVLASVARDRLK